MKKILRALLTICFVIFISGCVSATYEKPSHINEKDKYSVVLQRDFDTVWKQLIQYSAGTFFAIDNYEKDSGLITLSFGSSNPSKFVTGGHWSMKGARPFEGDYVDYLSQFYNGTLKGKMNIVVISESSTKTMVKVNARYIFTIPAIREQYVNVPMQSWSFDTGSCDTVNISSAAQGTGTAQRTICPTYKAEHAVINGIK